MESNALMVVPSRVSNPQCYDRAAKPRQVTRKRSDRSLYEVINRNCDSAFPIPIRTGGASPEHGRRTGQLVCREFQEQGNT